MPPTKSFSSQELIDEFWKAKLTPARLPVQAILPRKFSSQVIDQRASREYTATTNVTKTYNEAKATCMAEIAQIVQDCRRKNQKFNDNHFDLTDKAESTCELYAIDTRNVSSPPPKVTKPSSRSVSPDTSWQDPAAVKRVGDIFDSPKFFVEGTTAKNIHQGRSATCWFVAALSTARNCRTEPNLIERLCVDRDEEVGVYGFVFFRDGEWFHVIVDDKLYLRTDEFEHLHKNVRHVWEENCAREDAVEEYRKLHQTNSRALIYAHSSHPDETWVPLLEKAFAKAHGDYDAIATGSIGNGVEDLTGGTTTVIYVDDILSKTKLWEDICKIDDEFVFGCASRTFNDPFGEGREGIYTDHAYSILKAKCYGKERLLMVMNPWGCAEWNGPWSDGSSQWTIEAIKELGHVFGDDGVFWIRYEDFLRKFKIIYRTRLFTADWSVTQRWISLAVPWAEQYQDIKFNVAIAQTTRAVIVLSQLDERYFRGLIGQYRFSLSFQVFKSDQTNYLISSSGEHSVRSVSAEVDLEAGSYEVRLKVSAVRFEKADKIEDVIKTTWLARRKKLQRIGLSYELAHAKAQPQEIEESDAQVLEPEPYATGGEGVWRKDGTPDFDKSNEQGGVKEEEPRGRSRDRADLHKEKNAKRGPSDEPWNASCVVGLRVYTKDSDAAIQVIDPKRGGAEASKLDDADSSRDGSFSLVSST